MFFVFSTLTTPITGGFPREMNLTVIVHIDVIVWTTDKLLFSFSNYELKKSAKIRNLGNISKQNIQHLLTARNTVSDAQPFCRLKH